MAYIFPQTYFNTCITPLAEANLSITSSAVLYGLSLYTVFPLVKTAQGPAFFRLREHYDRLINSAKIIGIQTDQLGTYDDFRNIALTLYRANFDTQTLDRDVFVRATLHVDASVAGTRSRGLHTVLSMFIYQSDPIIPADGARVKTSVWRRVPDYAIPSRAKVNGAYVNSVLGKQDALDSGYDDCIFLDTDGHVCEFSAANIFVVRDNVLITPSAMSDILEGISRKTLLEIAHNEGIICLERTIDLTELYIADEIFASGTSAGVAPIIEIDARKIGTGSTGTITQKLHTLYTAALHGEYDAEQYMTWVG